MPSIKAISTKVPYEFTLNFTVTNIDKKNNTSTIDWEFIIHGSGGGWEFSHHYCT